MLSEGAPAGVARAPENSAGDVTAPRASLDATSCPKACLASLLVLQESSYRIHNPWSTPPSSATDRRHRRG